MPTDHGHVQFEPFDNIRPNFEQILDNYVALGPFQSAIKPQDTNDRDIRVQTSLFGVVSRRDYGDQNGVDHLASQVRLSSMTPPPPLRPPPPGVMPALVQGWAHSQPPAHQQVPGPAPVYAQAIPHGFQSPEQTIISGVLTSVHSLVEHQTNYLADKFEMLARQQTEETRQFHAQLEKKLDVHLDKLTKAMQTAHKTYTNATANSLSKILKTMESESSSHKEIHFALQELVEKLRDPLASSMWNCSVFVNPHNVFESVSPRQEAPSVLRVTHEMAVSPMRFPSPSPPPRHHSPELNTAFVLRAQHDLSAPAAPFLSPAKWDDNGAHISAALYPFSKLFKALGLAARHLSMILAKISTTSTMSSVPSTPRPFSMHRNHICILARAKRT